MYAVKYKLNGAPMKLEVFRRNGGFVVKKINLTSGLSQPAFQQSDSLGNGKVFDSELEAKRMIMKLIESLSVGIASLGEQPLITDVQEVSSDESVVPLYRLIYDTRSNLFSQRVVFVAEKGSYLDSSDGVLIPAKALDKTSNSLHPSVYSFDTLSPVKAAEWLYHNLDSQLERMSSQIQAMQESFLSALASVEKFNEQHHENLRETKKNQEK